MGVNFHRLFTALYVNSVNFNFHGLNTVRLFEQHGAVLQAYYFGFNDRRKRWKNSLFMHDNHE